MKVDDLEVGVIYKCLLSGEEILVIETLKQKDKDDDSDDVKIKAGKSVVRSNSGDYKFVFSELHDGQLEKIIK